MNIGDEFEGYRIRKDEDDKDAIIEYGAPYMSNVAITVRKDGRVGISEREPVTDLHLSSASSSNPDVAEMYMGVDSDKGVTFRKSDIGSLQFLFGQYGAADKVLEIFPDRMRLSGNLIVDGGITFGGGEAGEEGDESAFPVSVGGTGRRDLGAGRLLVGAGSNPVLSSEGLTWDDVNERMGVNTAAPAHALDVSGTIRATAFVTGDASGLSNLDAAHVTTGVLEVARGGTGAATFATDKVLVGNADGRVRDVAGLHWDGAAERLGVRTASPRAALDVAGGGLFEGLLETETGFSGDGAGLCNLDADMVAFGVLDVARGGSGAGSHAANKILVGAGVAAMKSFEGLHWQDDDVGGEGRLGVNTSDPQHAVDVSGIVRATAFVGDGSGVANLDAGKVTGGVLDVQRGGTGADSHARDKLVVGDDAGALRTPTELHWDTDNARLGVRTSAPEAALDVAGDVRVSGHVDAGSLAGDGSAVTDLDVDKATRGELTVVRGGTGAGEHLSHKVLVGDGSGPLVSAVGLHWDAPNGRFGIQTDEPSFELDVAGTTRTGALISADAGGASNLNASHVTSGVLEVVHGGTGGVSHGTDKVLVGAGSNAVLSPADLHWDASESRLGIRVSAPQAALDVAGDAVFTGLVTSVGDGFAGDGSRLTDLSASNISAAGGALDVTKGGTGRAAHVAGKVLVGDGIQAVLNPDALHWDATNARLGVRTSTPSYALDVDGSVRANRFIGNAADATDIDADNVTSGVLAVPRGGTGVQDHGSNKVLVGDGSNAVQTPTDLHWDLDTRRLGIRVPDPEAELDVAGDARISGRVEASSFSGKGDEIEDLDADNVTKGVLDVARGGTGASEFRQGGFLIGSGGSDAISAPLVSDLHWDGTNSRLGVRTAEPAHAVDVTGTVRATDFVGDGSGLANLDAGNVTTGELSVRRGGTGVGSLTQQKVLVGNGTNDVLSPSDLHWDVAQGRLGVGTSVPSVELTVEGDAEIRGDVVSVGGTFAGDGSGLTALNAGNVQTGTLRVSRGGTGNTALTRGKVLVGDGSNAVRTPTSLHWDAASDRLGVNTSDPQHSVDVTGELRASFLIGDGSRITGIDVSSSDSGGGVASGVLAVERGGTGASIHDDNKLIVGRGSNALSSEIDLHWDADLRRLGVNTSSPSASLEVNGDARFTGNTTAAAFFGDGSGITNINLGTASTSGGLLGVTNGGTGAGFHPRGRLLVGNDSNALLTPEGLRWDDNSARLGVNTDAPEHALDVSGTVRASEFIGGGVGLTGLNADGVSSGTLLVARGGTGAATHRENAILVGTGTGAVRSPVNFHWDFSNDRLGVGTESPISKLHVQGGDATVSGSVSAGGSFSGDGAGLTGLNANNLAAGVTSVARGGTGAGSHSVDKLIVGSGTGALRSPADLHWDGSNSRLGIGRNDPEHAVDVAGTFRADAIASADGSGVSNLDATNVSSGTLAVARGGTGASTHTSGKLLVGEGTSALSSPEDLHWNATERRLGVNTSNPTTELDVRGDARVDGSVTAGAFVGDGSGLTNLSLGGGGVVDVPQGGTGAGEHATDKILVGNGSNAILSPSGLHWDGANGRLGVNESSPEHTLDVNGSFRATEFIGNGSELGDLNATQVTSGVLAVEHGGTGTSTHDLNKIVVTKADGTLQSSFDLHWEGGRLGVNTTTPSSTLDVVGDARVSGTLVAASLEGAGPGLTDLDASALSSGLVEVARGGTGAGEHAPGKFLVGNGSDAILRPSDLHWDEINRRLGVLTSSPEHALDVAGGTVRAAAMISADASGLSNLDASHVTSGVLDATHGGTGRTSVDQGNLVVGNGIDALSAPANLHWDAANARLGVNRESPASTLDVGGDADFEGSVTATAFFGDGSGLTNIDISGGSSGVIGVPRGGTGKEALPANKFIVGDGTNPVRPLARLHWEYADENDENNDDGFLGIGTEFPRREVDVVGTVRATAFEGDGSEITNIDAANISSDGTGVSVSSGGTGRVELDQGKVLVGDGTNGVVTPASLHWSVLDSRLGVNVAAPAHTLDVGGTARADAFTGDGSGLTALDANSVSTGTLPVSRGGTGDTSFSSGKLVAGAGTDALTSASGAHWDATNSRLGINTSSPSTSLDVVGDATVSGALTAASFAGDGSALTNLDFSGGMSGVVDVENGGTGASNLTRRKLLVGDGANSVLSPADLHWDAANARLGVGTDDPSSTFHVIGTARATDFAGSGAGLTDLNASRVTSGTLGVARGGTGAASLASSKLLFGRGTDPVSAAPELHWNAALGRLGVGEDSPQVTLHVSGTARATSFEGGGAGLTDLDADAVSSGTVGVRRGGTGTSNLPDGKVLVGRGADGAVFGAEDFHWDDANRRLGVRVDFPEEALDVDGTVQATAFVGDGSGLTGLDLDAATAGTVAVARGGTGNVSMPRNKLLVGNDDGALVTPSNLHWDIVSGARLGINTATPVHALDVEGTARATFLVGDGAGLSNLNASHVGEGTLPVNHGGTGATQHSTNKVLVGNGAGVLLSPNELHWDAAQSYLGIKTTSPERELDVAGDGSFDGEVRADAFVGDGSRVTNLSASNITTDVLSVQRGGTGTGAPTEDKLLVGSGPNAEVRSPSDLHWDGVNARLGVRNVTPAHALHVTGTTQSTSFVGSGEGLSNLDADHVTGGVLDVARGGAGVGEHTADKVLVGNGTNPILSPSGLHWDGVESYLGINTAFPLYQLDVSGDARFTGDARAGSFTGDGAGLSNLDASHVTSGVLGISRGGTGVTSHTTGKFLIGNGAQPFQTPAGMQWNFAASRLGINEGAPQFDLDVGGTTRSTAFIGDGASLSNLDADHVTSGTLVTTHGGTGRPGDLTTSKLLVGNGADPVITPSGLHWNSIDERLGVRKEVPEYALHVGGDAAVDSSLAIGGDATVGGSSRFEGTAETLGVATFEADAIHRGKIVVMDGQDGREGRGVHLWTADDTDYAIYMTSPGFEKSISGGNVAIADGTIDGLAVRFRVADSNSTGFVFENSSEDVLLSLRGSDGHTFFAGEASFSSPAFFDEQVLFRNTLSADGQATFRDIVTFEDDVIHLGKISVMEAQDGGTDRGIFLWSLNSSDYGIYVASAGDGQSLSGGTSAPGNDFDGLSVRFRVENGESNGFVFENSEETRLFSIRSSDGSAYFSGDVTHEGDAIHRGRIIVMDGRDGGSGRGIFLQDADTTEYGIYLATAGASRSMGDANAVPGKGFDDLSLRIRVNDNSSNGIVFENSSEDRLFSIRGNDGLAHFEGSVTHQGRTDLLDDVHFYRNNNVRIETVSAGSLHSLAIDANGHVYSWGFGAEGSLGTGSTENEVRPVSIKDEGDLFGKRVIGVAAGESHSLAVDDNGVTYSWGNGDTGALGIGTFADEEYTETRPVSISENGDLVGKTVISVSAGSEFSLALDSQGGLYSWGFGERGRLGLGSESVVFSPTMVNGFGDISSDTVIISISAGGSHALAVDENGTVYAWGDGEDGRLGTGAGTNELEPVSLANAGDLSGKKIVRVAAGHNFSLALDENGVIYSWGLGNLGRLGTGSVTSELTPVSLAASGDLAGQNIIAITAGDQHAFALDDGGSVYAWGGNANGQLGDGSTDDSSTPRNISIVSQRTITGVSAGGSHSLATDDIDGAYSWGLNGEGQLGNGEINGDDVISPRLITDSGDFLRDLARFTNEFIVQGKSVFEDRVGIGSSDPEALLHVAGEVYASNIRMAGDGSAAEPAYSWVDDSNMGMFRSDSNVLSFSTAGMERLRIDDVGHVGIGVSNIEANSALHVDGDIRIRNSDLIGACNIYTKTDVDDLIDDVDDNLAEGLYWDSETQRLGIGTVVPDAKLHVVGEAITSSLRLSSDGTAVDPAVTWVADADTGMYRVQEDALGLSTGGVERMRVAANGYVGVNSSNPSEMLYVDGNIYATGEMTSASDRRLKTNLRSLESENCLAKLRQMSGYRFNRTDWDRLGGGAQRDTDFIGFVAQDVLQVMPELVKHDDKNDRYSVNYAHMAVVLTEAIKTLAKDKEALQNDVFELRRDVAELRRNAMI